MTGMELERTYPHYEQYSVAYPQYCDFLANDVQTRAKRFTATGNPTDRIKDIFKASFPLSNGSPLAQVCIQGVALDALTSDIGCDAMVDAFENFELDAKDFYPPRRHSKVDGKNRELDAERLNQRIPEIWNIYEDIARNLDDPKAVTETEEINTQGWGLFKDARLFGIDHLEIWANVCIGDLRYLRNGRPGASSPAVKYRSTVKTHILDGVTTGSAEVDFACRLTRAAVEYTLNTNNEQPAPWMAKTVRNSYAFVKQTWEQRHGAPGRFAPEDFAPNIGMLVLDQGLEGNDWVLV